MNILIEEIGKTCLASVPALEGSNKSVHRNEKSKPKKTGLRYRKGEGEKKIYPRTNTWGEEEKNLFGFRERGKTET